MLAGKSLERQRTIIPLTINLLNEVKVILGFIIWILLVRRQILAVAVNKNLKRTWSRYITSKKQEK